MQIDEGLDTGEILLTRHTPITATTTGGELHDTLAALGGRAVIEALDGLAAGTLTATPQPPEGVTYAAKLSKAEAELDFSRPAAELAARVRAFNPWPVAWCQLGDDRLRLLMAEAAHPVQGDADVSPGTLLAHDGEALRIACGPAGDQVLRITQAQWPGGRAMAVRDLLNSRGDRLPVGLRLGRAGEETPT